MNDFSYFLQDHADCERKASSMALSFVAKCPDKIEIIPELIETALEELEHFQQVYKIMQKRGIRLRSEMPKDQYILQLIEKCRSGKNDRLLDRMLVASIVECRGAERFKLIADELIDLDLKDFYKTLWISEAKHGNIFVKFALNYWNKTEVYKRLDELNNLEADICSKMEWTPRLH
jgi:tRNA-(ms[2]io[6]A)-hydroxylase